MGTDFEVQCFEMLQSVLELFFLLKVSIVLLRGLYRRHI
jgi:hypothetical protein